jgi:hypothetical protein
MDEPLKNGPYALLKEYMLESKTLSIAYKKSEAYYRMLHKYLTYPIIVTSAVASVCSGFALSQYIVLGLSLTTLLLSGFNSAINPKEKEHLANQVSTEFGEISSNILQFILENSKTRSEIKAYSQLIHELLNTWKSQSPSVKNKYLAEAQIEACPRLRLYSNVGESV